MTRNYRPYLVLWCLFSGSWSQLASCGHADESLPTQAVTGPEVSDFLAQNCVDCHRGEAPAGGLDLTTVAISNLSGAQLEVWIKIHDKVDAGLMPPDGELPRAQSEEFRQHVSRAVTEAEQQWLATEGRTVWRRMNRYEYEHSLRDLFDAPWLQLKEMLPEDGEQQRFNKIGEALDVSAVHLSRFMQAADTALRQVIARHVTQPNTAPERFYARDQPAFNRKSRFSQFNRNAERATFPLIDYQPDLPVLLEPDHPYSVGDADPILRERESFGVVASSYEPLELRFDKFKAPEPGLYILRFKGYTFWAGPSPGEKWWRANREVASIGRRSEPIVIYSERPPRQLRRLGQFDFQIESSVQELHVWLLEGETIRPDAVRLFRSRPPNWRNPLAEPDGMPGVAFNYMEVVGPIHRQWPPTGHQLLFGDLPLVTDENGGPPSVQSTNPLTDGRRLLSRFIERTSRRPQPAAELERFMHVIQHALDSGNSFMEAMLAGYTAVLCSPNFLCLTENPGQLDDFALASRLSYFLWNSAPDDSLRQLAEAGTLHAPDVLRSQVQRMLADKRSTRFVEAFLAYWLDLRRINATSADEVLYPDYYLDDALVDAALEETQLFFTELVELNLPARNLVDSDFTFVNEALAKHYDLPAVTGVHVRRVALPPNTPRGGLLTQASVLKVTANGTQTSPVVRGAWVSERFLGEKPPAPPAGVPAVEPDTRGATTLRKQLELHRTEESCNLCHARIDPPGFALENFDVLGGWQDRYRSLGELGTPAEGFGKNGQPLDFRWGSPVDASGELADGQKFQDIHAFKQILANNERQLARNLMRQLLVFATGAPMRFSDREETEILLDAVAQEDYGVRSIIEAVATSRLFLYK
jgi:hypothetical protein